MFTVDPNTIYTAKDLVELSPYTEATIYNWFKTGLKHKGTKTTKTTTGRALLEYFESEAEDPNAIDPKVLERLRKAGAL